MLKMKNIRIAFVFTCVMCSLLLWAKDDASDFVTVKGQGSGVTVDVALKDAYRDAIETAVGLYVEAEQMVKNDSLIKDEILIHSNAYIENYKELKRETVNGVVKVKIMALVRKQELASKISGVMPARTVELGDQLQKMHVQTVTRTIQGESAAAMFSKLFSGIDFQRQYCEVNLLMTEGVTLVDQKSRSKRFAKNSTDTTSTSIDYPFHLTIDQQKYFESLVPMFDHVLTEISISEPKEVRVSLDRHEHYPDLKKLVDVYSSLYRSRGTGSSPVMTDDRLAISIPEWGNLDACCGSSDKDKPIVVFLITKANKALSVVRAKEYELPQACAKAYFDFEKAQHSANSSLVNYAAMLIDEKSDPIVEAVFEFGGSGSNDPRKCWRSGRLRDGRPFLLIGPWFSAQTSGMCKWQRFSIPSEDLPRVKAVKVELEN